MPYHVLNIKTSPNIGASALRKEDFEENRHGPDVTMDVVGRKGLMFVEEAWSDFSSPYNGRDSKHG